MSKKRRAQAARRASEENEPLADRAARAREAGADANRAGGATAAHADRAGPARAKPASLALVALLLFGSGLCGLVYQVAWLRELRLVFGASTVATSAVLAVFMGGLGLGGWVLGKRAARYSRPLGWYAALEGGIALSAAVTPFLLRLTRTLYVALGGTPALGLLAATALRLLLTALVLCVPTFLMGGTLSAAAHAVETDGDPGRQRLALVYGANTLGAVAGAVLPTFFLLERLGTRGTLWSACALNVAVALCAILLARRSAPVTTASVAPPLAAPGRAEGSPHARLALWAAALTGFVFLLMELVWYRMLAPLLGGSTFTFGLILAVALFGIGAGGLLYALFGRRAATLQAFALTCALEALCIAAPFALGDRIAVWTAQLRVLGESSFLHLVLGWTAVTAMTVLPAAVVSGVQFPLLIALLGRGRDQVGRDAGMAYAFNTAGAIAGSLAGGFGLLPLLSAPGAWRAVVVALAVLGAVAAALAAVLRQEQGAVRGWARAALAPATVAALAISLLFARGPTAAWRHSGIGAGRGTRATSANVVEDWLRAERRSLVWEEDGVESAVGLRTRLDYAFVVNGKTDGSARVDASTQVMSGLLGAILHPREIESALVIGLGTGSTAGWLGKIPSLKHTDVVELEPAILRVARDCAPVNQNVLTNPRVQIAIGDAREVLLTTSRRYDYIFSEPSNPYRAGIASLFTEEFYRSAAARLSDDGVLMQWVQAYEVDVPTVRTIFATLSAVFPAVETWQANESDMLIMASKKPIVHDVAQMRARIAREPYRSALAHAWRAHDLEDVLARFVAPHSAATRLARDAEGLNTDDRMRVEFGFARALGSASESFDIDALRDPAHRLQLRGEVDWQLVERRRLAAPLADWSPPPELPESASFADRARVAAYRRWILGESEKVLQAYRAQPFEVEGSLQLALLAESFAQMKDEAALPYIERLRVFEPVEADAILARLRLRQGRVVEAADALVAALERYRTDPWPIVELMQRALFLAHEVAEADRQQGERVFRALSQPFAVGLLQDQRQLTLVSLASLIDPKRLCEAVLAQVEPNGPWRLDFLEDRVRCYQATQSKLLPGARADLEKFKQQAR